MLGAVHQLIGRNPTAQQYIESGTSAVTSVGIDGRIAKPNMHVSCPDFRNA
jgi:hypothetical protein